MTRASRVTRDRALPPHTPHYMLTLGLDVFSTGFEHLIIGYTVRCIATYENQKRGLTKSQAGVCRGSLEISN